MQWYKYTLPLLAATLAGKERYRVENLDWSSASLVSNLFRAWELVFWRRVGIRAEASVATHQNGRNSTTYTYHFHSWETLFMHTEHVLRMFLRGGWLPSFSHVRVHVPMLAHPGGFMTPASPYLFAIAFDAANSGTTTGAASITISLTVGSGSDRALVSNIFNDGYSVTGFTYAGSSTGATDEGSIDGSPYNTTFAYSMYNPTSGTNDLVVSKTGNSTWNVTVASYSGVDQTDVLEAGGTVVTNAGSSVTGSVTTVTDNAWAVAMCATSTTSAIAAGADTTLRDSETGTSQGSVALLDSAAAVTPAGARSLICTRSGNQIYIKVFSLKPAVAAAAAGRVPPLFMLLGVGN